MDYKTATHDYLKRARQQLDNKSCAGLFYAAFELRCGIETRMYRYLEARENITKLKRKGWKVATMAAQIEGTFNTVGKICVVTLISQKDKFPVTELRFIPISKELKTMAGKLGVYLHAQDSYRNPEDSWWEKTRNFLESVYKELTFISSGTLMGAPLLNPTNNSFHLEIELPREKKEKLELLNDSFQNMIELKVKVQYLNREETT